MTYYRVYGPGGSKRAVIAAPDETRALDTVTRLYYPEHLGFEAMWDKAIDRPVVLDTPIQPML